MPNPSREEKAEIAKLVTIRPANDADLPFVRDSWKNAAYKHVEAVLYLSKHGKKPTWEIWKSLFPGVMDRILSHAQLHVVCSSEERSQILAFAVTERLDNGTPVLHWVATKKQLWRHGLAEILLRELGFDPEKPAVFTFSGSAYTVTKERIGKWEYVPFWLFALGTKPQDSQ